jgi:sn-glycerol 3-phosphate transport system ATP-binding protein
LNQPSRQKPGSPSGGSVELRDDVKLPLENDGVPEYGGKDVTLGIRPEHFKVAAQSGEGMPLKVNHVELLGADTLDHGHFGEEESLLTVRLSDIQHFKKNTALSLNVPPEKLHLFDQQTGNGSENNEVRQRQGRCCFGDVC